MTRFRGGPFHGEALELQRSPIYLRVTCCLDTGGVDALDQLDDEPRARERVEVYERVGRPSFMHVLYSGRRDRRRGQWFAVAEYRHLPDQPGDAVTRSTAAWRAWASAAAERRAAG